MNFLVIYAHPNPQSLNASIKDAFLEGAKEAGHTTTVLDLYAEGFDPVLRTPELHGEQSAVVKKHQDLIRSADWMVFVYPIWWSRCPAILEGWFDKVFSAGFGFRYKKLFGKIGVPEGLLPCTKAVVLETYGGPGFAVRWLMGNLAWRRLKNNVLRFCGVKTINHLPFYSSQSASEEQRKEWLSKVNKIAKELR
jgi:NAD(P)H dehydrogenase (quinone)